MKASHDQIDKNSFEKFMKAQFEDKNLMNQYLFNYSLIAYILVVIIFTQLKCFAQQKVKLAS